MSWEDKSQIHHKYISNFESLLPVKYESYLCDIDLKKYLNLYFSRLPKNKILIFIYLTLMY